MPEDLTFHIAASWTGSGREGHGTIRSGGLEIPYAAPTSMGGQGTGTSPEELLLAAVTACYSGTLFRVLQQRGLSAERLDIRTTGLVTGYPRETRFQRLAVHPTVAGGDPGRLEDYRAAAETARGRCFIGGTVQGSIDYVVGEVSVAQGEPTATFPPPAAAPSGGPAASRR